MATYYTFVPPTTTGMVIVQSIIVNYKKCLTIIFPLDLLWMASRPLNSSFLYIFWAKCIGLRLWLKALEVYPTFNQWEQLGMGYKKCCLGDFTIWMVSHLVTSTTKRFSWSCSRGSPMFLAQPKMKIGMRSPLIDRHRFAWVRKATHREATLRSPE